MNASISIFLRKVILVVAFGLAAILSSLSIRAALAEHYSGLGTLEGYTKATELEPSNATYWDLLGRFWQLNLERPDSRRAIECYRISLSLDPLSATTWLALASAYEDEDKVSEARTAYLQAKHVYPASADVACPTALTATGLTF
jgi:tetratricopeptide (TPR) repeat protein